MPDYMDRIRTINAKRKRYGNSASEASDAEKFEYRRLAGTILYLGQTTLFQACLVASKIQQWLGCLRIQHILDTYCTFQELYSLNTTLLFPVVLQIEAARIVKFSVGARSGCADVLGHSGIASGLKLVTSNKKVHQSIAWLLSKQKAVSHTLYGAEIAAAGEADGSEYFLKEAIDSLF